jgi:hypothetical protein
MLARAGGRAGAPSEGYHEATVLDPDCSRVEIATGAG